MKPILEIQHLYKSYQIGAKRQRYLSLRDSLVDFAKKGWQRKEIFWALQDLNFQVYPGETLGIIGRNGAGKTTLLKILSRITPPTKGKITVRGRLASLLEVGTGFHPELTGRENIFLNGAILGLRRQEIKRQFDAIVDFSGVEQFLETPLKHYSSGMQLRLAFAVAAHLEPEILLIDEVLAVGDAEFQRRCLGKMDEVARSGRTVLFVSHNLTALKELCPKSIYIDNGTIIEIGDSADVIENYLSKTDLNLNKVAEKIHVIYQNHVLGISSIFINGEEVKEVEIQPGQKIEIEVTGNSLENCLADIEVKVKDNKGTNLAFYNPTVLNLPPFKIEKGAFQISRSFYLPTQLNRSRLVLDVALNLPGSHSFAFIPDAFYLQYKGEKTPSGIVLEQKPSSGYFYLS